MPRSRLLPADQLELLVGRVLSLGRLGAGGREAGGGETADGEHRHTGRVLVGIAGAPGAGKTTLAEDLVAALSERLSPDDRSADPLVTHLPMDGFHLADVQLDALGLRGRKGAPETFDAHGYLATLGRLRSGDPATVYVPGFERVLEQPVAAAIGIPASVWVVVSEGNYLLLDDDPWPRVRAMFDEVWFVDLDDEERLRRLVERHTVFGKERDAARQWALGPDQANADRILTTRRNADLVVTAPALGARQPGR